MGGVLVLTRQPGVAGDIGVEDGGQFSRKAFFGHRPVERGNRANIVLQPTQDYRFANQCIRVF